MNKLHRQRWPRSAIPRLPAQKTKKQKPRLQSATWNSSPVGTYFRHEKNKEQFSAQPAMSAARIAVIFRCIEDASAMPSGRMSVEHAKYKQNAARLDPEGAGQHDQWVGMAQRHPPHEEPRHRGAAW
jgi:hypothetical protein